MLISPPSGVFEIDTLLDTRIGVWCLGCSESLESLQSLTLLTTGNLLICFVRLGQLLPLRSDLIVTEDLYRYERIWELSAFDQQSIRKMIRDKDLPAGPVHSAGSYQTLMYRKHALLG